MDNGHASTNEGVESSTTLLALGAVGIAAHVSPLGSTAGLQSHSSVVQSCNPLTTPLELTFLEVQKPVPMRLRTAIRKICTTNGWKTDLCNAWYPSGSSDLNVATLQVSSAPTAAHLNTYKEWRGTYAE